MGIVFALKGGANMPAGKSLLKMSRYLALFIHPLIYIEILSYTIAYLNPGGMFDNRSSLSVYANHSEKHHSILGWVEKNETYRPVPSELTDKPICAWAFGESFVHGDDVADTDVWSYDLSKMLGCQVRNYGVGGYGTDQAYLYYDYISRQEKEKPPVVYFGFYYEQLRRNEAASWFFYCCGNIKIRLKPYYYKEDYKKDYRLISLPEHITAQTVESHHHNDRYRNIYEMRFPYFASMIRVLYYRLDEQAFKQRAVYPRHAALSDKVLVEKQLMIMEKARAMAQTNGQRITFLYFVAATEALQGTKNLNADFISQAKKRFPGECHISLYEPLQRASLEAGQALVAKGHLNPQGNHVVAESIRQAFENECKL